MDNTRPQSYDPGHTRGSPVYNVSYGHRRLEVDVSHLPLLSSAYQSLRSRLCQFRHQCSPSFDNPSYEDVSNEEFEIYPVTYLASIGFSWHHFVWNASPLK